MAIEKATYWLAVGVLALGLNSTFQNQEAQWAHNLADQARRSAVDLAQRGMGYLAMAEVMLGSTPAQSSRLQAALARVQVETAQAQAAIASREASRALREAQRVNLEFNRRQLAYMAEDMNACPDQRMLHVPRVHVPRVEVHVPDVHIPNVEVRVPEVRVPLDQKFFTRYSALGTRYSPDFDFSAMPNMTIPNVQVHVEIRQDSGDNGPI